jgi:hypothetical protein
MIDWITGEKFQNVGDFTFAPPKRVGGDYNKVPNTLDLELVKDGDIIYTHGLYARELLNVIRETDKNVYIVTHNCDWNIDASFIVPNNVIKWYGQNINVINPKIESIPIGLENPWWFVETRKKEKMMDMLQTQKSIRNLVYVNHNISTNPSQREAPYQILKDKSFATLKYGLNGQGFDEYLDDIYHHQFVVCPEGNGIDTHRTWETLYMGSIPIEKRNINNQFYTDLPICFVDKWEDITEEYLERWLIGYGWQTWNLDKLQFKYWKNKIQSI